MAAAREAGDTGALLDGYGLAQHIALMESRWDDCVELSREALAIAAAAGDEQSRADFANWIANALAWGRRPVDDGIAIIDELIEVETRRLRRAGLLTAKGLLLAYADDRAAVEAAMGEARAIRHELGEDAPNLFRRMTIEKALDDPAASLANALAEVAALEAVGETGMRSTALCLAGQAHLRLGNEAEARRCAEEARSLASSDDAETQLLWRAVAAIVEAREGRVDEAVRLTDEALAVGASTDSLSVADVWLARAEVLALAARAGESRAAAAESRAIWAAKGHVNGIKWADAWL